MLTTEERLRAADSICKQMGRDPDADHPAEFDGLDKQTWRDVVSAQIQEHEMLTEAIREQLLTRRDNLGTSHIDCVRKQGE